MVSKKFKEKAALGKKIFLKNIGEDFFSLFLPNQEPLKCTPCACSDGVGRAAQHQRAFDDMCCTCVFDLRHP